MNKDYTGAEPLTVLKEVFGYKQFRLLQENIILNVLAKRDTLAVMPTGGGKSLCYQIPSLIFDGITVVVSPLISLMQDQVDTLVAAGVNAVFLNSTLEWENYLEAMNSIRRGETKIVYLSPEGLGSPKIRDLLHDQRVKVSCITIDEAHCVSQWGHDFRPDYLEISGIRKQFPNAVCLALTATATKQVRDDIIKNLALKQPEILISSFNRPNIFLDVQPKRDSLTQITECIKRHWDESGIIYCFSRKQVDQLTQTLIDLGYSALNYHAGLSDEERKNHQTQFIRDQVQIMVATLAFGMGIDKPNVRFVIHYDMPKSLEQYYQEIGRAGRDGLPSEALLLYSGSDVYKIRHFFTDAADPQQSEDLLQQMVSYASGRECRRKLLLSYFGENYTDKNECCCDVCSTGTSPLMDMTVQCQKFLSCIIRTNSRFGTTYIVNVLLGSREKRIVENGHNMISTWGIGCELDKYQWTELAGLLLQEEYIIKTDDYGVLMLTNKGLNALKNRDKFMLAFNMPRSVSHKKADMVAEGTFSPKIRGSTGSAGGMLFPKPQGKKTKPKAQFVLHKKSPAAIDADDEEAKNIAASLKKWRKKKADEMNVPPYVIFGDKTLNDIAVKKPKDLNELMDCYGIGENKAQSFGEEVLKQVQNDVL